LSGDTAGKECDVVASGEKISVAANGAWTPNSGDQGADGYSTVTAAVFERPSETRVFHEWNVNWAAQTPGKITYAFHPLGEVDGYEDGHAKFIVSQATYTSGCDGVDWAWDIAGSCNLRNIQRNAD